MEKPVRRKASHSRFAHLINEPLQAKVAPSTSQSSILKSTPKEQNGRKYHLPATAITSPSNFHANSTAMVESKSGSSSGDVDLDISVDFISKMENDGVILASSSSHASRSTIDKENSSSSLGGHTRGMAEKTLNSRSRKQPPTPLSLNSHRTSHTESEEDHVEPIPLSATKRAADSGIRQIDDRIIIQEQRAARKQSKEDSLIRKRSKKVLGENRNLNNAQIASSNSNNNGNFMTEENFLLRAEKRGNSTSHSSNTHATSASIGHGSNGNHFNRRSRTQSVQGSTDHAASTESGHSAPVSFKTPKSSLNDHSSNSHYLSPSTENVLGLFYPAKHVEATPKLMTAPQSPLEKESLLSIPTSSTTQKSTPTTPISPLFAESETNPTSSDSNVGSNTPGTATSALFKIEDVEKVPVTDLNEAMPAPIQPTIYGIDTIQEESISSIDRSASIKSAIKTQEEANISFDNVSQHLQKSTSDNGSASDASSDVEQQKLIVSTLSSPDRGKSTADTLFVHALTSKKGPWPKSPFFLDETKRMSLMAGLNKQEVGLGLSLDVKEEEIALEDALNMTLPALQVEQAIMNREENISNYSKVFNPIDHSKMSLKPPSNIMRSSPSTTSSSASSEGFAINITPPAPVGEAAFKQEHRVDVPESIVNTPTLEAKSTRWSAKIWNMANSLRSPTKAESDFSGASSPLRSLTLVGKQDNLESLSPGIGSDAYHSAQSSSTVPSKAQFSQDEAVSRPAAAMYTEQRSSRMIRRNSSRIKYKTNATNLDESEVRLDMERSYTSPPPQVDRDVFDQMKSPRVAQSPTGVTPKMDALFTTKPQRHSWTPGTSNPPQLQVNSSPWLAPKRQSYTGKRDSELYNLASNAQQYLDNDAAAVEIMLSDDAEGLRRRSNHRSVNSMPTTPTFIQSEGEWRLERNEQTPVAEVQALGVSFQDAQYLTPTRNGDGRQSRLNLYKRPLSGIAINQGLRNHGDLIYDEHDADRPYLHVTPRRPTSRPITYPINSNQRLSVTQSGFENDDDDEGFFSYSSRTIQNASPSQALFFAGFLMMPWLWFVGGWALDDNGMVYIERERNCICLDRSTRIQRQRRSIDSWTAGTPLNGSNFNNQRRPSLSGMSTGSAGLFGMDGGFSQRLTSPRKVNRNDYQTESVVVQVARNTFDWRDIDSYVVCNRVAAMIASVVAFGGFGVAVAAVVKNY